MGNPICREKTHHLTSVMQIEPHAEKIVMYRGWIWKAWKNMKNIQKPSKEVKKKTKCNRPISSLDMLRPGPRMVWSWSQAIRPGSHWLDEHAQNPRVQKVDTGPIHLAIFMYVIINYVMVLVCLYYVCYVQIMDVLHRLFNLIWSTLKKIDVVQVGKVRLWRAGDKAAGALLVQTTAPQ